MFIRKRKLAFLICAVLSLFLLPAVQARADGAEDNAGSWYIDAGVSALAVDLPAYAPIWIADLTGFTPPYTDATPDTQGRGCLRSNA